MFNTIKRLFVIILLIAPLPALAELSIQQGYIRALPPSQPTTAAFMRLVNTGDKDVVITGAAASGAKTAEIHSHKHHNGMMSMVKVDRAVVPANGELVMAPGQYHLMLINLTKPLREGDQMRIQLFNGDVELVSAILPVRSVLNKHH